MGTKGAKTANNILTVLNVLLKKAVDWDVIDRMPCSVTLLPVPKTSMSFYDFDEYERLVAAASSLDATAHLIVLLGGEAGLRCGEMIALEWRDVDLAKRQLCVQRSDSPWPCRSLETFWRRGGSPKRRSMARTT